MNKNSTHSKISTLIKGLKSMSKWGLGPAGGGGTLDQYSNGQREAYDKMRAELRRLLKQFSDAPPAQQPPSSMTATTKHSP